MKKLPYFLFFLIMNALHGQTIQEKKESFHKSQSSIDQKSEEELNQVNEMLNEKRFYLKTLYERVQGLYLANSDESRYKKLLQEIQKTKQEIIEVEEMWRDRNSLSINNEGYALWHQPDATLNQLIIDYGRSEFLYLIPPEIGNLRLSINSSLPVPKESWGECLDLILAQNGVGIRELNPFIRELYLFKTDLSLISTITANQEALLVMPDNERICFVLAPESPDPRSALNFLLKFSSPASTTIELIRHEIYIISNVATIKELMKLYDFFKSGKRGEEYQLITLSKVEARGMITILESAFFGPERRGKDELRIIALDDSPKTLFLFGTKEEINKAISLIQDVENQIDDPKEKTLFWYTAKHSDAEELATLLAKVYDLLIGGGGGGSFESEEIDQIVAQEKSEKQNLGVNPPQIVAASERVAHKTSDGQNNFIVDNKTGSIIMVVEQNALGKIKDLLKKLDVPKKMVQIEVLLFEKKVSNQNKFGLNLLKMGDGASKTDKGGINWNSATGILEFLISHSKGSGIPAFDMAYKFLLGQDDIQINASPSVLTVNQTPATIAIVEEISINMGESEDKKKVLYSRAQYGITMQITPTINVGDNDEGFITLDTDITFDTTTRSSNDRPNVTRRHIKNHVRIGDGQTVILGGLRRKTSEDHKDSLPFLGEIPGIGKLFSMTDLNDSNTEMFLFITPKIIYDPTDDLEKLKKEELSKRPGDLPEYLFELNNAKNREKKRLCEGSLTALFGRPTEIQRQKNEYDGK